MSKQSWPLEVTPTPAIELSDFCQLVWERGLQHYRDLPWRHTHDPYAIWISEVMLQQTQVARVDGRWQQWLERFPSVGALAEAASADVLEEWQGMGYNRRALALHTAARRIVEVGEFPMDPRDLVALPGIGPATAAGIRAFAFNLPGVYLETNVRTVFLHELYPDEKGVPDRRLVPLVQTACPTDDPRGWYYALLDYGAWLKKVVPNPSRRSSSHVRQSRFEGSHRQRRAQMVRVLLSVRGAGVSADEAVVLMDHPVTADEARALLSELAAEGFCYEDAGRWYV